MKWYMKYTNTEMGLKNIRYWDDEIDQMYFYNCHDLRSNNITLSSYIRTNRNIWNPNETIFEIMLPEEVFLELL